MTFHRMSNCKVNEINDYSCPACGLLETVKHVKTIHSNSFVETMAMIGYKEDIDTIIITFRGTLNIPNWILNALFITVDYP